MYSAPNKHKVISLEVLKYDVSSVAFVRCDRRGVLMSPYSRYGPLPSSESAAAVLGPHGPTAAPPDCRLTAACRFLRWLSRLGPHTAAHAAKASQGNQQKILAARTHGEHALLYLYTLTYVYKGAFTLVRCMTVSVVYHWHDGCIRQ